MKFQFFTISVMNPHSFNININSSRNSNKTAERYGIEEEAGFHLSKCTPAA